MSTIVTVHDLIFEYPGKRALDNISFELERGTVTALVGPNGAGKTTLLRTIAALERPFSGSISVDGVDTQDEPRLTHQRIGYLSDFYGLYNGLTVKQCLLYGAMVYGIKESDRKKVIERVASDLNLMDLLTKYAGTLSRGQRQRLAIAQAIVHQPTLLLLDEPAAGLDPEARADLSELILRLQAQGITIVVSSHILAELEDYSSHMLTLQEGKVLGHQRIATERALAHRSLLLQLSHSKDNLATILKAVPAISALTVNETEAMFTFTGTLDEQSSFVRFLVEQQVPVCALGELKTSMQDVYLSQLREARSDDRRKL